MSAEQWILVAVGGGAAAFLVAVIVWLRRGSSLVGPVFWYELVALARRGQQPRLRGLLAVLLLVGLLIAYLSEFPGRAAEALTGSEPLTRTQAGAFAHAFMIAVLVVQLVVVMLITPALVGGAIAEEKERKTLDHLLSSLLTNREIVLGKLAARLVFVGGVVIAGVPVLALTMLFGAVDESVLFGGYLITAMSALSLGAYSLLVAIKRETLRDTLVQVYLVVGGLTITGSCCGVCIPGVAALSPPSALGYLFLERDAIPSEPLFWIHLGVVTILHGSVALICVALAIRRIRRAPPQAKPRPRVEQPWFRDDEPVHEPTRRAYRTFAIPRIDEDHPLLWKEQHFTGRFKTDGNYGTGCGVMLIAAGLFAVGLTLFFSMLSELNHGRWIGQALNLPTCVFVVATTLFVGVAMGVRAAASVAREREQQTLDSLLMLPLPRSELLTAKWLAQALWARYWLWAVLIVTLLATLLGGVQPIGMVEGLLQAAGWLALVVSLGVWLSVRCRTVTRATVYLLLWVVALVFGPLLLSPLAEAFVPTSGQLVRELSLPVGVWEGLYSWEQFGRRDRVMFWQESQLMRFGAGLAYTGFAGLFWLAARYQFGGEFRPESPP